MTGVSRHYALAAGGTGGHMIPAYALARELIARGHRVMLITDARGEAIPGLPDGTERHVLPAGRMQGGIMARIRAVLSILRGRSLAKGLFDDFRPEAVVGFGGYPALPTLLAARSLRIPSVIHEQNAVLGRVNRFLAGGAAAIATSYEKVERLPNAAAGKVHLVGNPVRAEVLTLRDQPFPPLGTDGLLRILVTGGSQGARILSQVVPEGLAMLPEHLRHRLQVTQQCRPEDIDDVRASYAEHEIPAELGTYFENMAARLADAHLFIGRAGASTIAELTAVGRPAVLIPLAIATDDHQAANTADIVKAGGARAIREKAFNADELARQIEAMAAEPDALANAAHQAWNCGRPDAAKDLADLVEGFGGSPMMDVIRVGKTNGAKRGALSGAKA